MNNINLTSSMRNNLLSLQKTAKMQTITQNKLATGKKVSTAIDNPSSFYTSTRLNSRANDLGKLIDSMGQAVQTIKASNETLAIGEKFLAQAKGIANEAVDNMVRKSTVSLDWLVGKGLNRSQTATTKSELLDKMNSARAGDTIYISGKIDMGDTSLVVKDGVKIAGTELFIREKGLDKEFMVAEPNSIKFNLVTDNKGIVMGNNTSLSNLSVEASSDLEKDDGGTIYINNKKGVKLEDLNLSFLSQRTNSQSRTIGVITNKIRGEVELLGVINIKATGGSIGGIIQNNYGNEPTLTINKNAVVNIETDGPSSPAIYYGYMKSEGTLNLKTTGLLSPAIASPARASFSGVINIEATGSFTRGIRGDVTLEANTKLMIKDGWSSIEGTTSLKKGAIVGLYKNGAYKVWQADADLTTSQTINSFDGFAEMKLSTYTHDDFMRDFKEKEEKARKETPEYYIPRHFSVLYNGLLEQYNSLVKDSGYKGVNLLLEQGLKVNFNEDRSGNVEIKGVDASLKGLGLKKAEWFDVDQVNSSLDNIQDAINTIREIGSEFGGYYNIISTREDFTKQLINVLSEGADKLVLADMNEESANMLALQTRQQLAVNSLNLANQSSKSVLKLF